MYRLHKRTFSPGLFELEMAGACDPGLTRAHNEDAIALQEDDGRGFFYGVVCDGMGGYNAGELASATAVHTLAEIFNSEFGNRDVESLAQHALHLASERIDELAELNPDTKGMGCTAVLAFGQQEHILIAHVGDSRAYLFDGEKLIQITRDHTLVQEMLEAELIKPEEAEEHPYAGHISRCLGHGKKRDTADFQWLDLEAEQSIMLCSDGLAEVVPHEELQEILATHNTRESARALIEAANRHGGPDNISAIVLRRLY